LDTAKVSEILHKVYGVAGSTATFRRFRPESEPTDCSLVFGHEVWRPNIEDLRSAFLSATSETTAVRSEAVVSVIAHGVRMMTNCF